MGLNEYYNELDNDESENDELEKMLINCMIIYYTIVESSKIAKEFLNKYNQELFLDYKEFERQYLNLLRFAKKKNICISSELRDVGVTKEDVIERILDNEAFYISLIYRYSNNYFGYLGNGLYDDSKRKTSDNNEGAGIREKEIKTLYETIINDVRQKEETVIKK